MLVVVIAWALAAVLMLTGTLLAAQSIEGRVTSIVGSTSAIDDDLDAVRLAARTSRISGRILEAAAPLSSELDQVIVAARSIDRTAGSILDTAESINGRVVSINATAGSINATVRSIRSNAGSIESTAESIDTRAGAIDSTVESIERSAGSIETRVEAVETSVDSIDGRLSGTLDETRTIDSGVAGINIRADRVIDIVRPVRDDTQDILDQVGQPELRMGHRQRDGDKSLHGHANSIDCQLRGRFCGDR